MKLNQQLSDNKFDIKNYYSYIGILIFLASLILGYFFIFEPLSKKIKESHLELLVKEGELGQREKNIEEYEKVKKFNSDFPDKVAILDEIILNRTEVEQFISQLEKIAIDSGVSLPSIDPKQETAGGSISAALNLTGSYENMKKFLRKIENNKLTIYVLSINISPSQDDLSFTIEVKTGI